MLVTRCSSTTKITYSKELQKVRAEVTLSFKAGSKIRRTECKVRRLEGEGSASAAPAHCLTPFPLVFSNPQSTLYLQPAPRYLSIVIVNIALKQATT